MLTVQVGFVYVYVSRECIVGVVGLTSVSRSFRSLPFPSLGYVDAGYSISPESDLLLLYLLASYTSLLSMQNKRRGR